MSIRIFQYDNKIISPSPGIIYDYNAKSIPQAYAWYEASKAIVNNGVVTQLIDNSGNGKHLQMPNALYQPGFQNNFINGYPGIVFSGGQFMEVDFGQIIAQPCTYFCVWSVTRNTGTNPLFGGYHQFGQIHSTITVSGVNRFGGFAGTWANYPKAYPFPATQTTIVYNGALSTLTENGVTTLTGNMGGNSQRGLRLGGYSNSSAVPVEWLTGVMAELIFYPRLMTSDETLSIEFYFRQKYQIY
jgi:hypothetical protein